MLTHLIEQFLVWVVSRVQNLVRNHSRSVFTAASVVPVGNPTPDSAVIIGDSVPSPFDRLRRSTAPGDKADSREVTLSVSERRTQMYVHGATGTGKSVLLSTLLEADIAAGRGTVLLDARGDLVDRVLLRLAGNYSPDELRERLVLIDLRAHAPYQVPGGDTWCVGFNPLAEVGADAYSSAFFCLAALEKQFDLGVATAELMRNLLLALALSQDANNPSPSPCSTLMDIEAVLLSDAARQEILARVDDASVRRFFAGRFPDLAASPQYVSSVMNKLSPFFASPATKRFLGMGSGSVSFRRLFDTRPDTILLCSLGADELHSGAGLIGSLIIAAVKAALMRSDRPPHARKETTFLYLDEFENFGQAGELITEILSEGRRFGLGLVAAHQSTTQLEPKMRSLIRSIAGIQVFFACGGNDAELLAGELPSEEPKPVLRKLLIAQPVGNALLIRRGKPLTRLHTHYTPDPSNVSEQAVAALRQASMERWGRPIVEVEAEIAAREQNAWSNGADEHPLTGGRPAPFGTPPSSAEPLPEVRDVTDVPKTNTGGLPKRERKRGGPIRRRGGTSAE